MIEALMFVALGFLAATFFGLLMVPAIARRADRLARRRAEAAFPLSLEQVAAERDHLRAELAMRERVLERKAEKGQALRSESLAEIGRRDMDIAALREEIAGLEGRIAGLQGELSEMTHERDMLRERLAAETETLNQTRAERETLRAENERLATELAQTRDNLSRTETDLAAHREALERTGERLANLTRAHEELQKQHDTGVDQLNGLRIRAADLQTALATAETTTSEWRTKHRMIDEALVFARSETAEWQKLHEDKLALIAQREAKIAEIEQAFMARGKELADERETLKVIAAERDQARMALRDLRETLRGQEKLAAAAARDAARRESEQKRQIERLTANLGLAEERLERLRADREKETAQVTDLRGERARLKQELVSLRQEADAMDAATRAENQTLRKEMNRIADLILAGRKGAEKGSGA